jgi:hypothetical protein
LAQDRVLKICCPRHFGTGLFVKPIFISYSSRRRDLTETLARRLEGAAVTLPDGTTGQLAVWWDRELRPGRPFTPDITRALDEAPAVIVIWSDGAVASDWVYAEAVRAAGQHKLVTVSDSGLDPKRIPLPFNIVHSCRLDDHPAILNAIQKIIAGEGSELPADLPGATFRNWLIDPKQEALPARAVALRPASLLVARHRIVPFIDIHGLRENFVAWATGTPAHALGRRALGRLVHGPGGLGKTRALIEVADALTRDHGWLAGFVPRGIRGAVPGDGPFDRLILGGRDAAGLLLVVDYAESRQDDVVWLADRLMAHADRGARPARLVLLSRGAGDWWRELVRQSQSLQDLFSLGGDRCDEIEIPERIVPADRLRMFEMAVESFRALGDQLNADGARSPAKSSAFTQAIESGGDYDRPLAVQMAALLHAYGVDAGPGGHTVARLLDLVLGLEYEHWGKILKLYQPGNLRPNLGEAVRHGVAQLTLVDGVATADAALIGADPFYRAATDINVPDVQRVLERLFPRADGGIAPLEPDLIGEHHVAEVTDAALLDVSLVWAGNDSDKRRQILTVLQRASRPEHGPLAGRAEALLDHVIRDHVQALAADMIAVMTDTPGALLERFERHLPVLDEETLTVVGDALPLRSLALMEFSLRIAARLADDARQTSDDASGAPSDVSLGAHEASLSRLAGRLNNLGVRLSSLGRREEALVASQEAVAIYRRLAETRPDAFLADLALSLGSQGEALAQAGQHADAAGAFREGLAVIAPFVERHLQAFDGRAGGLLRDYIAACEKAGTAPDVALLERIVRTLGVGRDAEPKSKQLLIDKISDNHIIIL